MASPFPSPRLSSWLATGSRGVTKLGLTQLEDRTVPSSSIPLNAGGWIPIGGTIIPAAGTPAANPLPVAGRLTGVTTNAVPFQPNFNGVFNPTDPVYNTALVSTPGGGLARTTDGGLTWNFLTDNLPNSAWQGAAGPTADSTPNRNLQFGALGVSPYDSNLILGGTGESATIQELAYPGTGILRSADGGATFSLIQGTVTNPTAFIGGNFEKFVFSPLASQSNIVFAVFNSGTTIRGNRFFVPSGIQGVYRSLDFGQTWESVSNNLPGGFVFSDLVISPDNPAVAFITVSGNGIFRANNFLDPQVGTPAAQTPANQIEYTQVLGGTGTQIPGNSLQFTKIAFASGTGTNQPSRVYAISSSSLANGPSDQLFRSDDSGINFRRLDPPPNVLRYGADYSLEILADPTSPRRVFFAGRGAQAVQVLTNGDFDPDSGDRPNYVNLPLPNNAAIRAVRSIAFDNTGAKDANGNPLSPGRLLVATDGGLFRFQAVNGRATTVNDYLNPTGNLELVSLNGTPGPRALLVQEFYSTALSPRDDNVVLGGTSANGTARFQDNGPFAPGSAGFNNTFYWSPALGDGTQGIGQDIEFSQIDPNLVYRVSNYDFYRQDGQDGGLFQRSTDGGQTFTTSIGGIVRPTTTYSGYNDFGPLPGPNIYSFKTAFIRDPSAIIGSPEARLFLGTVVVNRSENGGQNWTQFGPDLPFVTPPPPPGFTQTVVSAIGRGLASLNPNLVGSRIYAAVNDRIGTLPGAPGPSNFGPAIYRYIVPRPGVTPVWTNISPGTVSTLLPPSMGAPGFPQANDLQGVVRQLVVDPTVENIVYAITDSTAGGRVLRTINGGASWVDLTANLPGDLATGVSGLSVFSIALDPNRLTVVPGSATNPFTQSDDDVYIGTSAGVWVLTDPTNPASTWTRLAGTGVDDNSPTGMPFAAASLPDARVYDVEVNTTIGVLSAATFGRGMWQYQIRPFFRGQLINDLNGNGVRDANEGIIVGGVVQAIDNTPTPSQLANTTTTVNGEYIFRSLPDDNYTFAATDASTKLIDPGTTFFQSAPPITATVNENSTINGQDLFVFDRIDLSGVAYIDNNGNGQRDPGELPAAGFTVSLNIPGGGSLATAITDDKGRYTFRGLGPRRNPQNVPGAPLDPQYVVALSKTGFQTTQQPAAIRNITSGVDITSATPVNTQIGVFQLGSFSGNVFEDLNADGVRGPGESGLAGYLISLIGPGGKLVANTTTDGNGAYRFDNVQAGQYQIFLNGQPNFRSTTSGVISIGATSGTVTTSANFGVFGAATLTGVTYDDTNVNGLRDPGEPTLGGLPVDLFVATAGGLVPVASSQSDGNGVYQFNGVYASVGASTFIVRLGNSPNNGQSSSDATVSPVSRSVNTALDIGVARAITISGTAFEDLNGNGARDGGEPGLAGGSVSLRDAQTGNVIQTVPTDGNGNFVFTGVVPLRFGGSLQVIAGGAGLAQTTPPVLFTPQSGVPITGQTIGLFRGASFSGTAALDTNGNGQIDGGEPRLGGRVVQLLDGAGNVVASTTTDGNGNYTLASGPGAFRPFFPVPVGSILTGSPISLTTAQSGQGVGGQNFTEFRVVAGTGRVFNDLNADGNPAGDPGLANILVQIFDANSGALLAQTRTDGNGNYTIPNLGGGPLRVQVVPPAPFPTPPSQIVNPTSGTNFTANFGLVTSANLRGNVFRDDNGNTNIDAGERPFAGRSIDLLQNGNVIASTVSDSDGSYSFGGLTPGAYSVRINTPAAVRLSGPASRDFTVTSGGTATQNFGIVPTTRYAVAADGGGGPRVRVFDALTGSLLQDFFVYEETFTGGVRVTTADVNGDGVDDLIVAPGKGGGPRIRVIDGVTQAVIYDYFAYEESFRNGLFVTAADVNGDGFADIITGTEAGGGPRVTVADGKTGGILADYFAYDENFRGGVRVGSGVVTGTALASVLTAPGAVPAGGVFVSPNVVAWSVAGGQPTPQLSFDAFDSNYAGGVYVAAAQTAPGGFSSIVVGSGQLQADANVNIPSVRVFNPENPGLVSEYEAFPGGVDPNGYRSEVRVSLFDRTGDGLPEIALANGPNSYPRFRFIDPTNGRQIGDELQPFEFGFTGGIFVG